MAWRYKIEITDLPALYHSNDHSRRQSEQYAVVGSEINIHDRPYSGAVLHCDSSSTLFTVAVSQRPDQARPWSVIYSVVWYILHTLLCRTMALVILNANKKCAPSRALLIAMQTQSPTETKAINNGFEPLTERS